MSQHAYADFQVGDPVYCLAWIGQPFVVVAKDDEHQAIGIETPPGWPTVAQVDIFSDTMFLLTKETWDHIWYWPDRAGERYLDVFQRFVDGHKAGELVTGCYVPDGLSALGGGNVDPTPDRVMMLRIAAIDEAFGQIRVHPVAAIGSDGRLISSPDDAVPNDAWLPSGPVLPLRIAMRNYRWCLTFGELVVNWEEL